MLAVLLLAGEAFSGDEEPLADEQRVELCGCRTEYRRARICMTRTRTTKSPCMTTATAIIRSGGDHTTRVR